MDISAARVPSRQGFVVVGIVALLISAPARAGQDSGGNAGDTFVHSASNTVKGGKFAFMSVLGED